MKRLLSKIDTSRTRRLAIADAAEMSPTPSPQVKGDAVSNEDYAATAEDYHFTLIAQQYPLVAELQLRLALVSGPDEKAPVILGAEQIQAYEQKEKSANSTLLQAIVNKGFTGEHTYTTREAIVILCALLGVSEERSAKGLEMMFKLNLLSTIPNTDLLYLSTSTPF